MVFKFLNMKQISKHFSFWFAFILCVILEIIRKSLSFFVVSIYQIFLKSGLEISFALMKGWFTFIIKIYYTINSLLRYDLLRETIQYLYKTKYFREISNYSHFKIQTMIDSIQTRITRIIRIWNELSKYLFI